VKNNSKIRCQNFREIIFSKSRKLHGKKKFGKKILFLVIIEPYFLEKINI